MNYLYVLLSTFAQKPIDLNLFVIAKDISDDIYIYIYNIMQYDAIKFFFRFSSKKREIQETYNSYMRNFFFIIKQ